MARKEIDLTTPQPNGKMGEPTKSAWEKVNDMTSEIYSAIYNFPGLIIGMIPRYLSANVVTISSGACHIPSVNTVIEFPDINVQGPLQINTWYHLYCKYASGSISAEIISTPPSAPYSGTARTKPGDSSSRYIYSIKTDSNGAIIPFIVQSNNEFRYCIGNPVAPLRSLSNGKATTRTSVNLSGAIPITAIGGLFLISNTDSSLFANLTLPGIASAAIVGVAPGGGSAGQFIPHPTNASQVMEYYYASTPANGLYIDAIGFTVAR